MFFAVPKLVLLILQACLYLAYAATPVYTLEYFHVLEILVGIGPDDTRMKILNYGAIYALLVVLQFATLRRFSKSLLFGMALKTQEQ